MRLRQSVCATSDTIFSLLMALVVMAGMAQAGPIGKRHQMSLPLEVKKDLQARCVHLLKTVHPGVDDEWVESYVKARIMTPTSTVRVAGGRVEFHVRGNDSSVEMWGELPCGQLGIRYFGIPPGAKRPNPIDGDVARGREIARAIVLRLVPRQKLRAKLRILKNGTRNWTPGGRKQSGPYVYGWEVPGDYSSARIEVWIGDQRGLVDRVIVTPALTDYLGQPGIMREEALKLVEALPGASVQGAARVSLSCRSHYGGRRLTWEYFSDTTPEGSLERYAVWDANSGEVLWSDLLNGGSRKKPYRSSFFMTEDPEALFHRNVKKWPEEIKVRRNTESSIRQLACRENVGLLEHAKQVKAIKSNWPNGHVIADTPEGVWEQLDPYIDGRYRISCPEVPEKHYIYNPVGERVICPFGHKHD